MLLLLISVNLLSRISKISTRESLLVYVIFIPYILVITIYENQGNVTQQMLCKLCHSNLT